MQHARKSIRFVWIAVIIVSLAVLVPGETVRAQGPGPIQPPGDCTVQATPADLQDILDAAQPGDVICAGAGQYEEITVNVSGEVDNPITLTGDGAATIPGLIIENGVSHLFLYGLTIEGFGVWGVTVTGNNEDIVMAGLLVVGGESGIHFSYDG
ncbi:MAG: hypothetical protein JXQ72_00330, partial [Anaerolineae bacterium]|nr:hypothetical protein [Anaerolineae bacterium]